MEAVNTNCPSENKEREGRDKPLTTEEYIFRSIKKKYPLRWIQQINNVQVKLLKQRYERDSVSGTKETDSQEILLLA